MRLRIANLLYTQTRGIAVDPSIVQRDILYLYIRTGRGGKGLQKYNGIGGNGGSIYLRPLPSVRFTQLENRFRNNRILKTLQGGDSSKLKLLGKNAENIVLNVPMGVECVDADTKMLITRCNQRGLSYLIAAGGVGGSQFNAYKGQLGTKFKLAIHFKLTTNVGFVGLPNAGKSTLLKALVPAKAVKIADYPFTTLKPQVLDVKFEEKEELPTEHNEGGLVTSVDPDDVFSLSVADLPGIIEGASRNRGRGYAFLKHLEYSEIVIVVVDVHGFRLSDHFDEPFRNAIESVAVLNHEMEIYDRRLVRKPAILVLNKTDLPDGKQKAEEAREQISDPEWFKRMPDNIRPKFPIQFDSVLSLSAKDGEIHELKRELRRIYNRLHPIEPLKLDDEIDETVDGKVLL